MKPPILANNLTAFTNIDLAQDPAASRFVKSEVVSVQFASNDAAIESREGLNHYSTGDALIAGSGGDQWSVTRSRFDAKYQPVPPLVHGQAGHYRSLPIPVWAKQIAEPFTVQRCAGGDLLKGEPGDWLMQYAPGDYGIVENAKFQRVYQRVQAMGV